MQLIVDCCNDVHDWLTKDEKNVVGINCKAGKGRTGLIICCYLMHAGVCKNADDAMLFYGTRRTKDGKGVTIASQKRYVRYYDQVLKLGRVPDPRMLKIKKIIVNTIPNFSGDPCATVILKNKEVGSTVAIKVAKGATTYEIPADIPVIGDVKVQMDVKKGKSIQHTCHFWFNTGFIDASTNKVHFDKHEIDVASKDKKNAHFKPEFSIDVEFEEVPVDTSHMGNGLASPRRDGVEGAKKDKKDKKDKKKDKKGKAKEESDDENSADAAPPARSPESTKKDKDKRKDKHSSASKDVKETNGKEDPKEPADEKAPETPKTDKKDKKDKKDKREKQSASATTETEKPDSFAPPVPSSSGDDFEHKRKRRQSFYEIEENEENEDLSESAIEEKELEQYFEPESVDEEDNKDEAPLKLSPKASDKASSEGDSEERPAKKPKVDVERSDSSDPKDKAEASEKASAKSIALSPTSSSSRRGLIPASTDAAPIEDPKPEAKDSPKAKKEKRDKDSHSSAADSPATKSRKKAKAEN